MITPSKIKLIVQRLADIKKLRRSNRRYRKYVSKNPKNPEEVNRGLDFNLLRNNSMKEL